MSGLFKRLEISNNADDAFIPLSFKMFSHKQALAEAKGKQAVSPFFLKSFSKYSKKD